MYVFLCIIIVLFPKNIYTNLELPNVLTLIGILYTNLEFLKAYLIYVTLTSYVQYRTFKIYCFR